MKSSSNMTAWNGARAFILVLGMAAMATGNATGSEKTVAISGNSIFANCGAAGSDFALQMSGDLKGCLSIFIQNITCKELNGFDHYIERGREAFVGKWKGKQGRFTTRYTVTAAYAQGFCDSLDYSLELSGSCIHHVEGRSGVFADVDGVFTLFDVITGVTGDPETGAFTPGFGGNNFLYYGRIGKSDAPTLSSLELEEATPIESRSALAANAAVRRAQSRRSC